MMIRFSVRLLIVLFLLSPGFAWGRSEHNAYGELERVRQLWKREVEQSTSYDDAEPIRTFKWTCSRGPPLPAGYNQGMEPNPYEAPREAGYHGQQLDPITNWVKDRATELVLGLLLAIAVLPFVVAVLWLGDYM